MLARPMKSPFRPVNDRNDRYGGVVKRPVNSHDVCFCSLNFMSVSTVHIVSIISIFSIIPSDVLFYARLCFKLPLMHQLGRAS